jgi:HNH endonuclease/Helix-turn-helix domain
MQHYKPVLDYESFYEVSHDGFVRRIGADRLGRTRNTILKPANRNGYAGVTLSVYNQTRTFSVHRLMWEAFNGRIPDGMQINHINGDKMDNRLENLELCTPQENHLHMRHVLRRNQVVPPPKQGSVHPHSKLTEEQVLQIRKLYSEGMTGAAIARLFGLTKSTACRIVKRKAWTHI